MLYLKTQFIITIHYFRSIFVIVIIQLLAMILTYAFQSSLFISQFKALSSATAQPFTWRKKQVISMRLWQMSCNGVMKTKANWVEICSGQKLC